MKGIPSVRSAMTPFPYSIDADQTVAEAKAMMVEHRIAHLPVTRGHQLVGLLAERDIRAAQRAAAGRDIRAGDVCAEPYVVDFHARLDDVVLAIADRQMDSALVVRHGKLVGILTMTDVCRALGELIRSLRPDDGGNQAA